MDHERKRQIRLVVALSAAVLLAVALIYTSFSASSEAREPSEVLADGPSEKTVQVAGRVVAENEDMPRGREFEVVDEDGGQEEMLVSYPEGIIPDPFRVGRDVVLTGQLTEGDVFVVDPDALITKCPSKFSDEVDDTTNVEFVD